MSLKRNLAYNLALSISQLLFPLITIPYIARVLDPVGIGHVNFIDSLTYYFVLVAEFGMTSYGIREVAKKRNDPAGLSRLMSELLSLHLTASIASLLLYAGMVAVIYQKIGDSRLLFFSFAFLFCNAFACEWYFMGTEKFKLIAVRNIAVRILGMLSIFLLIRQPGDYIYYYAIITLSAILVLTWNLYVLFSEVSVRLQWPNWKQHARFLVINYGISLVYGVSLFMDIFFLRLFKGPAVVAHYAFAIKMMYLVTTLITSSFYVLFPRSVLLIDKNDEKGLRAILKASTDTVILLTLPLAVGFCVLAPDFTQVYFGAKFLSVTPLIQLLCLYPLLKSLSQQINKQILVPLQLEKQVLKGLVWGMVVFIISSLSLCYWYGATGACLALLLSEIVVLGYNIYSTQLHALAYFKVGVDGFKQAIIGSFIICMTLMVFKWVFSASIVRLLLSVLVCPTLYFFLLAKCFKNKLVLNFFLPANRPN